MACAPQANVKTVDMTEEMEKEAIELASFAMNEFLKEVEMAAHIKKEFDKKFCNSRHNAPAVVWK